MSQMSFGDAEYSGKRKKTRREIFLAEMEQVVPWNSLLALIEAFYPVAGRGRHPYPIATMLRVHLLQNWFGLSDPAMEEALYEMASMRQFARLTLTKPIPDETTILNFRRLLEENELAPEILARVNAYLSRKGLLVKRGSMVDATIIAAPSSTKNADGERDPDMHQTKKGNQWYFGMKAHIGADAQSGLVHTVVTTSANEADVEVAEELLLRWHVASMRGMTRIRRQHGRFAVMLNVQSTSASLPEFRMRHRVVCALILAAGLAAVADSFAADTYARDPQQAVDTAYTAKIAEYTTAAAIQFAADGLSAGLGHRADAGQSAWRCAWRAEHAAVHEGHRALFRPARSGEPARESVPHRQERRRPRDDRRRHRRRSPARRSERRTTRASPNLPIRARSVWTTRRPTALVAQSTPVYYITGTIHSPETGAPTALMELAYRLAVDDAPYIRKIRSHVITLITPVVESRRPRPHGGFVQLAPRESGQDAAAADVLGPLRRPRQQPRRDGSDLESLAQCARHLSGLACAGAARPARIGAVPLRQHGRRWPVQRLGRSDPGRRMAATRLEQCAGVDQVRHARRVHPRRFRYLESGLSDVHGGDAQRHQPPVRDLRQRRARIRSNASSIHPTMRAPGTGRIRRCPKCSGRSATTTTTSRPACSQRSIILPTTASSSCAISISRASVRSKSPAPPARPPTCFRPTTRIAMRKAQLLHILQLQHAEVSRATGAFTVQVPAPPEKDEKSDDDKDKDRAADAAKGGTPKSVPRTFVAGIFRCTDGSALFAHRRCPA